MKKAYFAISYSNRKQFNKEIDSLQKKNPFSIYGKKIRNTQQLPLDVKFL